MNLDEIRKRADAATDGPWPEPEYDEHERGWVVMNGKVGQAEHAVAFVVDAYNRRDAKANAVFIAHAREDVPALVEEVERLQAKLDRAIALMPERCTCASQTFHDAAKCQWIKLAGGAS